MKRNAIIAIVGRPNVGKSTFFNRVLSQRKAIVHAQEGITRDRIYGSMEWSGHELMFIDTGGYIPDDVDVFNAAVRIQAQQAVQEADMILFMVDGRSAATPSDEALAQVVRESGKPYIMIVNKCDTRERDDQVYLYHELGLDPVMPVSAQTGRATGDLLDAIVETLDLKIPARKKPQADVLRVSIVGMPNVGKSSLANALLRKEQTIVTPIAGTTRDSIDTPFRWYGHEVILIDTAGLRKKSKVRDSVEYFSNVRTQKAMERSDVVIAVIDGEKGFSKQDKSIVSHVISEGKGLVLVVNKWDLVEKTPDTMQEYTDGIVHEISSLRFYPILFVSAKNRQRVSKIPDVAWNVHQARQHTVSTRELNQWLKKVLEANPPHAEKGKLIRIKFVTQVHSNPPVLAFFCNYPKLVSRSYQRYLENQLRETFRFEGVPVKLSFRKK